jgi:hypothetical protein
MDSPAVGDSAEDSDPELPTDNEIELMEPEDESLLPDGESAAIVNTTPSDAHTGKFPVDDPSIANTGKFPVDDPSIANTGEFPVDEPSINVGAPESIEKPSNFMDSPVVDDSAEDSDPEPPTDNEIELMEPEDESLLPDGGSTAIVNTTPSDANPRRFPVSERMMRDPPPLNMPPRPTPILPPYIPGKEYFTSVDPEGSGPVPSVDSSNAVDGSNVIDGSNAVDGSNDIDDSNDIDGSPLVSDAVYWLEQPVDFPELGSWDFSLPKRVPMTLTFDNGLTPTTMVISATDWEASPAANMGFGMETNRNNSSHNEFGYRFFARYTVVDNSWVEDRTRQRGEIMPQGDDRESGYWAFFAYGITPGELYIYQIYHLPTNKFAFVIFGDSQFLVE